MDRIIFAIISAPPFLRWIILVPSSILGLLLLEIFISEQFKITPISALTEFIGNVFERVFKYSSIGACLAIGGLLAFKLIFH